MKALIVDDSRAMRMVMRRILTALGHEVAEARHGREALAHLQRHPDTAFALIDWNMPEMDGLELVRAIRADGRLGEVRLMMVTIETERAHIERALRAGVHEYMMKPFSQEVLREKLSLLGVEGDGIHAA